MLNEVIMPTGQVAIPEPILKILGVSNGDRIGFIIEKDSVRMVNPETRLAMQEARDISTGKIESKGYDSVEELMKDLLTDVDDKKDNPV